MLKKLFNKKTEPRTANVYAIRLSDGSKNWLSIGMAYALEDFVNKKRQDMADIEGIDPSTIYLDNHVVLRGEDILNELIEIHFEEDEIEEQEGVNHIMEYLIKEASLPKVSREKRLSPEQRQYVKDEIKKRSS